MNKIMNRLFNWKDHPSGIFWLLIPLGIVSFILLFGLAVFDFVVNESFIFTVVFFIGMIFYAILVMSFMKIYDNAKILQDFDRRIAEASKKNPQTI